MGLAEQLEADLRQALRAGDAVRVSTIRLTRAAIKNAEIEKQRPLKDEEIQDILPAPLTEEDLRRIIGEVIAEVGAAAPGDAGRGMTAVMPKVRRRAEGTVVHRVRQALGG